MVKGKQMAFLADPRSTPEWWLMVIRSLGLGSGKKRGMA